MTPSAAASFIDVLHADVPAEDRTDKLALYGWLVGSWDMEVVAYEPDGTKHSGRGEIHAGWVLQGRAIQDVWMIPRRFEQWANTPSLPVAGNWYGTTLRIYVNGVQKATKAATNALVASAGALRIGGNGNWLDEFFAGRIDDVRVYNQTLTAAQITTDMNTPVT